MFQNSPTCSKVIWGNEQKKICAMQLPRAKAQLWKEISAKFPNSVSNYNQFWSNNFNTKINQQSWFEIFTTFTPQIFSWQYEPWWSEKTLEQDQSHVLASAIYQEKESLPKRNYICLTFFTLKHCQRHNGPKALSTLTNSTPLVQRWSFEIFVKLQLAYVWQRARNMAQSIGHPLLYCSNIQQHGVKTDNSW